MFRLRAEETWGPTFTLLEWSDRKSLIQKQMESDIFRSDSFVTSLLGRMVLNIEVKSTKSSCV